MKNIKFLIGIIIGFILSIGISNAYKLNANLVTYDKKNTNLVSEDVQGAVNELGVLANTRITSLENEINTGKNLISTAITKAGVDINENESFELLAENINNVYSNGYNNGYDDGTINGQENVDLTYSLVSSGTSYTADEDCYIVVFACGIYVTSTSNEITTTASLSTNSTVLGGSSIYLRDSSGDKSGRGNQYVWITKAKKGNTFSVSYSGVSGQYGTRYFKLKG